MGKSYYKYLGVNKAGGGVGKRPAGAGGKGKGTAGIPLTVKAKSPGVNKAATAAGGNGKRLVAGPRGAKGAGGRGSGGASTLFHADHHSTAVKVMNEYYHEEDNRGSFEGERSTFSSTSRTTIKTSVKVTNEYYYHEEETFRVSEEDIHDATELLADGGGGGGYGDYYKDAGVGHDDAGFEAVDGFLNGDAYYDDVAAAGFDYLYDDDGVDGPDDWW